MGAMIQMNASSIIGADGFGMKGFCKNIMKKDLLHFVGSDAHNLKDRKPCIGKCTAYMEKVMGKEHTEKILRRCGYSSEKIAALRVQHAAEWIDF